MGKNNPKISEDQKELILAELLKGQSFNSIAEKLGISHTAFFDWRDKDPIFKRKMLQAREEGIHELAASVIGLADAYDNPHKARVKLDSIKWRAATMMPHQYGERLDLNVNQTVDMSRVLELASERVNAISARNVSEIVVEGSDPYDDLL